MNSIVVVLLAMAGAAYASAIEKRLVGGLSCDNERFYHVQVEGANDGVPCGGALLNTRWVLTAAHCGGRTVKVKIALHNNMGFFASAKSLFKGIFGSSSEAPKDQTIAVNQQFVFKDEQGNKHDIMLIKLNLDTSAKIPSVTLPAKASCTKPEEGKEVRVGGWGAKKADRLNKPEKSPRCATTSIAACDENDHKVDGYTADDTNSMCAFKPGVEVCPGDAGSAMEMAGKLQGVIVSEPKDVCANMIRILDICHYMDWIQTTMRK